MSKECREARNVVVFTIVLLATAIVLIDKLL